MESSSGHHVRAARAFDEAININKSLPNDIYNPFEAAFRVPAKCITEYM